MGDSIDGEDEGNDYIYRGEPSSPQDGEPWDPPAPPPVPPGPPTPPATTPFPTSPPPGFPPQQPPIGQPVPGLPTPPLKKKRWPWIVAAMVVLCGLPLGGCVALIGFGVNELNVRSDEIEGTVDEFFETVRNGEPSSSEALADGQAPCMAAGELVSTANELGTSEAWRAESTSFVERSGNSTLSSNADPETLFVDGRPDESAAVVNGVLETDSGMREVQILLSRPVSLWRICTITAR